MVDHEERNQERIPPQVRFKYIRSFEDFIDWSYYNRKKFRNTFASGIVGLVTLFNTFYIVPFGHEGVVKTFGAYSKTVENGLHTKVPLLQSVKMVNVKNVRTEEFGYRTIKADVRSDVLGVDNVSNYDRGLLEEIVNDQRELGYSIEGGNAATQVASLLQGEYLHLTGDLNIADVEFALQWKIKDAAAYLFNVKDPRKTLRDVAEYNIRLITGDRSVDEVITIGRGDVEFQSKEGIQKTLDSFSSGIEIVALKLGTTNPPRRVKAAFDSVSIAKSNRQTAVNSAWSNYNQIIPEAMGNAQKIIKQAKADSTNRVNYAYGDVQRFNETYKEYANAPEITRTRMYLETWDILLRNIKIKAVEQKGAEGGILLKLDLDKNKE
ncbi:MAG TPA: FtsH protease activity modulator HflK [Candidatus Nanoarchaeia archaeon]|nr:FtsH protease activity modulator HflK [Candidatus Nanoarchaeia archaeon]